MLNLRAQDRNLKRTTRGFVPLVVKQKSITVPAVRGGGRGKQEFWCVAGVKVICNRMGV